MKLVHFKVLNQIHFLLCFVFNISSVLTFHCGHIPPSPDQIRHVHIEQAHILQKRATNQNLRIKFFYDDSVKNITIEKFKIINETVLPNAINYWQQALFVKPFNVPIKLNRKCLFDNADFGLTSNYCIEKCETHTLCGEVVIPENHLDDCRVCNEHGKDCTVFPSNQTSTGIENADFVFYISTMQTSRCNKGSTIAYAAHCQQETSFNRPIAGHANICPESISTKPQDLETLISTFKHEILHALGFSVSLYAFYRDTDGNAINPLLRYQNSVFNRSLSTNSTLKLYISKRILRKVVRSNWKVRGRETNHTVFVISTPSVIKEVRDHFNCSELEGAELENQGEDGTFLTHWEKRLFENEAMTGTHTQNPVYSRITLALMEDTGWYRANYSLAQPLEWGKNLGCDFAMKSCKDWIEIKRSRGESIHPFCDKVKKDPLQTECTDNKDSVALCNLRQYDQELEGNFQNFDYIPHVNNESISYYGGSVALADYCPYIQEFTWKLNEEVVRGSKCSFEENNPSQEKNFALEKYGPDSKCMNHNEEMWEERNCHEIRQWQHWGSGCYKYECRDGFVHLLIDNYTFTCFYANQKIRIQLLSSDWLHKGTILCPSCTDLCQNCKDIDLETAKQFERKIKFEKHYLKCSSTTPILSIYLTVILIISFMSHSII